MVATILLKTVASSHTCKRRAYVCMYVVTYTGTYILIN